MPSTKTPASIAIGLWVLVLAAAQGGVSGLESQELDTCRRGANNEAECWFTLGLTHAIEAETESEEEKKRSLLLESAAAFQRTLELMPDEARALNNLAQVYADLDRDAEAELLFERVVSLDTPLRPFYHRNYGDFLARKGAWARAAEHYRHTLNEEPRDRQAHESLAAILAQHRPEDLPEYLWFLISRGQMLWAEEIALDRLANSSMDGEKFLTILVASRAGQSYLPEELSPARAAGVLRTLTDRANIGEGVREVLQLHEGKDFDPASFRWWTERNKPGGDSTHESSPRQAFRHLIRSLGQAQSQTERFNSAREYFRLAVLLTREEPDLEAFRLLLSLPSTDEDVAAIDQLAEWNEEVVQASPKQDNIYLYRHDLGLFYGFFRHWEGPASGIYQLSQAIQIGKVGPPDGPPDTATFDARVYSRLAAGYTETGRPEQATRTLYALVDAYRSHDMDAEADILVAMLESGPGGRRGRAPDRRREAFDDPVLLLRDFTTEPPEPPQ